MKNRKKVNSDLLFIAPGFFIYVLFMIVPIIVCFYFSITNWDGISPDYKIIGLKNFQNILTDRSFWESLKTTLVLTVFTMLFVNIFGIAVAVWMDKKERTYKICKAVIFVPCVLSSVVVSFIWSYMTQGDGGIINQFMQWIGMSPIHFFANSVMTTITVSFVIAWAALGFYVTVYDASLKTIPEEMYEAAKVDGAGSIYIFWKITLPMLMPGLTICTILSLINGLRQYDFVKIMTPQTISTVAVNAVNRMTEYNMLGYSSAIVLVLFLLIAVVTAIQFIIMKKLEVDY